MAEQWASMIVSTPHENGEERLAAALARSSVMALAALSLATREGEHDSSLGRRRELIASILLSKELSQDVAPELSRPGAMSHRL